MAEVPNSLESLLSCQVCFEEFEEDGDHVPRLLPCTHTLCHTCIGKLIRRTRIECPECRKRSRALNKERSFPQNKYLLTLIRTKSSKKKSATTHEFMKCEDHGKELNLYCRTVGCEKPICRICLRKQHKEHDVIDIEEQEKEVLRMELRKVRMDLGVKVGMLSQVKENIQERTKAAIEQVKKKKEQKINQLCDKMIQEVEGQNKQDYLYIDDEVSAMKSNIDLLTCLDQDIVKEEELSYKEIKIKQEVVKGIIEINKANHSGERSFGYPVFTDDKTSAEELIGTISREQITISLDEDATQMKCTVTEITDVEIEHFGAIAPLNEHTAVVFGSEGGITKAKSYSLKTGTQLSDINVNGAQGIAEVKLGGKLALAVSFYHEQKIEFRDADDLNHILLTHSVAPHQPGELCTAGSTILLYVDASKSPYEFYWLDLSDGQPKAAAGKKVIHTEDVFNYGMCFVQDGDKQLLVVASCDDILFAYNTETDKVEWKGSGKCLGMDEYVNFMGITTDGHHLFVCDWLYGNNCIQMFSASDGQYLGCFMKDEEILGTPAKMYWCEKTSSLVVLSKLKNEYHLKVLKVHY